MTTAKLADGVTLEQLGAEVRAARHLVKHGSHDRSDAIIAHLADDRDRLADELETTMAALSSSQAMHGQCLIDYQAAKARTSEARDCGQDGVCKIAPGCQHHWEERNRELVQQNARLVALLNEDNYTSHDYCTDDPDDDMSEPCTDDPPCWSHRVAAEIGG